MLVMYPSFRCSGDVLNSGQIVVTASILRREDKSQPRPIHFASRILALGRCNTILDVDIKTSRRFWV
jgi:hypothetical protein